ncbi:unnamed protein product [Rotaria magnacalcarata]|uniref:Uncharacterized protein n=1 Tax=Rotaria magnacalcarata TaxID=392030 RepID=A0A816QWH0_9BILA|nr:unnamed protein product [Rotaria magnacalcarata]CAF4007384.1 unnamed protein product [Rotaria magnacalcarata]
MDLNEVHPYVKTPRNSKYPLQLAPRNWSEPPSNQMSRLNNWNTNSGYPLNSQSNIMDQPQHRPSDQSQLVRMNAREGSTMGKANEINKPTDTDSPLTCQKVLAKVTSSKILFLMTGFIVSGIPLVVFVTLWMTSRSTSTSTSTTSSGVTGTAVTAATVSVSLPIQCYTYSTLSESYRNYQNGYACCYAPYDTSPSLTPGWYRFTGSAGSSILTTPVLTTSTCGISYPGYFNGTLPSTVGASVTGTVCFYTGTPCGYSLAPITAVNCNGYYIFYLMPVVNSNYRYCSTT